MHRNRVISLPPRNLSAIYTHWPRVNLLFEWDLNFIGIVSRIVVYGFGDCVSILDQVSLGFCEVYGVYNQSVCVVLSDWTTASVLFDQIVFCRIEEPLASLLFVGLKNARIISRFTPILNRIYLIMLSFGFFA